MNEIDILVQAGLSRINAEHVVALYTMANTLGSLVPQQAASSEPEPPAEAVSEEVIGVTDE